MPHPWEVGDDRQRWDGYLDFSRIDYEVGKPILRNLVDAKSYAELPIVCSRGTRPSCEVFSPQGDGAVSEVVGQTIPGKAEGGGDIGQGVTGDPAAMSRCDLSVGPPRDVWGSVEGQADEQRRHPGSLGDHRVPVPGPASTVPALELGQVRDDQTQPGASHHVADLTARAARVPGDLAGALPAGTTPEHLLEFGTYRPPLRRDPQPHARVVRERQTLVGEDLVPVRREDLQGALELRHRRLPSRFTATRDDGCDRADSATSSGQLEHRPCAAPGAGRSPATPRVPAGLRRPTATTKSRPPRA